MADVQQTPNPQLTPPSTPTSEVAPTKPTMPAAPATTPTELPPGAPTAGEAARAPSPAGSSTDRLQTLQEKQKIVDAKLRQWFKFGQSPSTPTSEVAPTKPTMPTAPATAAPTSSNGQATLPAGAKVTESIRTYPGAGTPVAIREVTTTLPTEMPKLPEGWDRVTPTENGFAHMAKNHQGTSPAGGNVSAQGSKVVTSASSSLPGNIPSTQELVAADEVLYGSGTKVPLSDKVRNQMLDALKTDEGLAKNGGTAGKGPGLIKGVVKGGTAVAAIGAAVPALMESYAAVTDPNRQNESLYNKELCIVHAGVEGIVDGVAGLIAGGVTVAMADEDTYLRQRREMYEANDAWRYNPERITNDIARLENIVALRETQLQTDPEFQRKVSNGEITFLPLTDQFGWTLETLKQVQSQLNNEKPSILPARRLD